MERQLIWAQQPSRRAQRCRYLKITDNSPDYYGICPDFFRVHKKARLGDCLAGFLFKFYTYLLGAVTANDALAALSTVSPNGMFKSMRVPASADLSQTRPAAS